MKGVQRLFQGGFRQEDGWIAVFRKGGSLVLVGTGKLEARAELPLPPSGADLPEDELYFLPREALRFLLEAEALSQAPGGILVRKGGASILLKRGNLDPSFFLLLEEPPEPENGQGIRLDLPPGTLAQAMATTIYASAKNLHSGVFRGWSLKRKGGVLRAAASDGYRLALWEKEDQGEDFEALLPAEALAQMAPLLGEAEAASLHLGPTHYFLRLEGKGARIIAGGGLIEGKFPPYEDKIPRTGAMKFAVSASDLVGALKLAANLGADRVSMGWGFPGPLTHLRLKAEGTLGDFSQELPIHEATGDGNEFLFFVSQLLEAIEALQEAGEENIEFLFMGPGLPVRLYGKGSAQAVLVPLRQ